MTLLRYSLDLYSLIAVPDRALSSSQPIHTAKIMCTRSTLYRGKRASTYCIFLHRNLQCCGARVTCLNLPLIYAFPLPFHLVYVRDLNLISLTLIYARVTFTRLRFTLRCVMLQLAFNSCKTPSSSSGWELNPRPSG